MSMPSGVRTSPAVCAQIRALELSRIHALM